MHNLKVVLKCAFLKFFLISWSLAKLFGWSDSSLCGWYLVVYFWMVESWTGYMIRLFLDQRSLSLNNKSINHLFLFLFFFLLFFLFLFLFFFLFLYIVINRGSLCSTILILIR